MSGFGGVVTLLLLTAGGAVVDTVLGGTSATTLGFLAGSVLAALLVQRRSLLTVCIAPPLVFAAVLLGQGALTATNGLSGLGLSLATELIVQFPVLAAGTGGALVVAVVRGLAERPPARHRG